MCENKTTKDLLNRKYPDGKYLWYDSPQVDDFSEDLKQSAIDDIKSMDMRDTGEAVKFWGKFNKNVNIVGSIQSIKAYIIWKFNLTEEDLK